MGAGESATGLAKILNDFDVELAIVGGHGNADISDLLHYGSLDSPVV
jgi:hypothetical protein